MQVDFHGQSAARFVARKDAAAMHLHGPGGDGQAQAEAYADVAYAALEGVEDALQPVVFNALSWLASAIGVGVGVTWYSPLGPLSVNLAYPIRTPENADKQVFQFSMGQTF